MLHIFALDLTAWEFIEFNNPECKMERDLIGYGRQLPKIVWPRNAKIAVNFALNYEEGSERIILDGDSRSEEYLSDWPNLKSVPGGRSLSSESLFEYGSRTGIWRLLSLFEYANIPLTVFTTGLALERNLDLAEALKQGPHEVAGHGYRWIDYSDLDEKNEREHIEKTLSAIRTLTRKEVYGWYTGRRSPNTRKLIVEAGIHYDSDSYSDDLPYWIQVSNNRHLIIPYALDTNDARYSTSPGWNTGDDFFRYLKDAFDYLYQEEEGFPKMMTVGIHSRLSGRPGRAGAIKRFAEYIKQFQRVWICRRKDIAEHWYQNYS